LFIVSAQVSMFDVGSSYYF